jgi:hypothetical protein
MIYTVLILMVRTVTRGRGGGVGQLHIEGEGVYDSCTEKEGVLDCTLHVYFLFKTTDK